MRLDALAGNDRLKRQLSARGAGGLSHAYILSGPAGSGRHTLARLLGAAMVCTGRNAPCGVCSQCKKALAGIHPDVKRVTGAGKPVTVEQIRALRADAHIRPNEAERKVYVLEGADTMNPSAQNAMLKLLEEGPAYAAFLLLAENAGGLLQTVRSRCEELALTPLTPAECEKWLTEAYSDRPPAQLRQAAQECQGILGRAVAALAGAQDKSVEEQAVRLCGALSRGGERETLEECLLLEKVPKEVIPALLERTASLVTAELSGGADKRRCVKAAGLLKTLKDAAALNVGAGALGGWLCGALFSNDTER